MRTISDVLQAGMDRGDTTVRIIWVGEATGEFSLKEVMHDGIAVGSVEDRRFILPYAGMRLLELM
jgi:hypothetical protein